jgi:hypothetical protein
VNCGRSSFLESIDHLSCSDSGKDHAVESNIIDSFNEVATRAEQQRGTEQMACSSKILCLIASPRWGEQQSKLYSPVIGKILTVVVVIW